MTERGDGPAGKIEQDKTELAQRVLDVVAENPQVKHVSGQVHKTRVQEHGGENR